MFGNQELEGRVALITGAASGIGRAAAYRFAEAGAAVMCADIDAEGAKVTAEQVIEDGGTAAVLQLDVSDEVSVEKSLQQTLDALGGFDILFNNAGVGKEDFDATLDINLKGVYYGLHYGAPLLASRGGGAIISTASIMGLTGMITPTPLGDYEGTVMSGAVAYTASKHAVVGMTRQYAIRFAKEGVRVNAVAPGYIDTPMTQLFKDDPASRAGIEALHPMGRLGLPDEIANAAVFLASDRASFITGVTLPVDGGYTAR